MSIGSKSRRKPKTLAEIDKHFRLWSFNPGKQKLNLKGKNIHPLHVKLLYAKQFLQQIKDFGKLFKLKTPSEKASRKDSAHRAS